MAMSTASSNSAKIRDSSAQRVRTSNGIHPNWEVRSLPEGDGDRELEGTPRKEDRPARLVLAFSQATLMKAFCSFIPALIIDKGGCRGGAIAMKERKNFCKERKMKDRVQLAFGPHL